ncbi:unnamed protein product [Effrenium voratum]|nr:unnamed protein product [Effrenium voratum]
MRGAHLPGARTSPVVLMCLRRRRHEFVACKAQETTATKRRPLQQRPLLLSWRTIEVEAAKVPKTVPKTVPKPRLCGNPVPGFFGHLDAFELQEISPQEADALHEGLGQEYSKFCRVTMKGPQDFRTIRLEPSIVACQAGGKPSASFSFALAVEKSEHCYVNVGLVEWVAARKEDAKESSEAETLAEFMKVKSHAEDKMPGGWLPEQHVHENPKQMMLGCRKGVQWFGDATKVPLFQDNIMPGSLLRFRCDYQLNRSGDISQVKVWLLPSPVIFEYGGEQTITEEDMWGEPLAQWWVPRWGSQDRKMRPLWVPAITLYTCGDRVTVAWDGPADLEAATQVPTAPSPC